MWKQEIVAYFVVRSLCLPEDHTDLRHTDMFSVRDVNQEHFEYEWELGCSVLSNVV
jgi:hypothetical protein